MCFVISALTIVSLAKMKLCVRRRFVRIAVLFQSDRPWDTAEDGHYRFAVPL
jgi:hypothetical protein